MQNMTTWYAQHSPHHRRAVFWQNIGMPLLLGIFAIIGVAWAYQVPTTTHLDLGTGEGRAYLHTFTAPETNGVYNYVFSTNGARMQLEDIGAGQHMLRIRMSGWRPPEAEPARLMLRVNHQDFNAFRVAPEPRQYHIPMYVKTSNAVVQWFSTSFVPDTKDARQLGVAVDYVAVQAIQVHPTPSDYINVLLIVLLLYSILRRLHLMPVYAFAIPCGSVLIALVVAASGSLEWRVFDLEIMWVALALLHLIIHLVQIIKAHVDTLFGVPEHAFAFLGTVFGIMFVFVTPPFQVPDESGHFFRAYQLSEGHLKVEREGITPSFDLLPESLSVVAFGLLGDLPFHPERKQTVENIVSMLHVPLDQDNKKSTPVFAMSMYSPIPYIPQTIAVWAGRMFNLPPLILSYIGRTANLFFSVFLVFLAIRTTPFFKWTFLLLACMPMVMFLRSSLSSDASINGIAMLLVAWILKCAVQEEEMNRRDTIILFLLSLALSLCKQAYFPIAFLCFLIPVKQFGTWQKYLMIMGILIAVCMISVSLWSSYVKNIYPYTRPNTMWGRPSTEEYVQFIFSDPIRFTMIIVNDYIREAGPYARMIIGKLGHLDTPMPVLFQISYGVLLVGIALVDGRRDMTINFWDKGKIVTLLVFNMALVSTSLYILRNPMGADYVNVQGRHLIPLVPMLFLLLYNRKLCFDIRTKQMHLLLIGYLVFSFVLTLYVIIDRYYLPVAVI